MYVYCFSSYCDTVTAENQCHLIESYLFKVISNFLSMDENDTILGIKGEVIHTYNKNEDAIKDTEYHEMVKERNNVILMGDNIGDAGMAEGMDHCDVIIKVGYLGRNVEGNLQNYLKKFDIVLVNENTVNSVNAILKLMLWFIYFCKRRIIISIEAIIQTHDTQNKYERDNFCLLNTRQFTASACWLIVFATLLLRFPLQTRRLSVGLMQKCVRNPSKWSLMVPTLKRIYSYIPIVIPWTVNFYV